MFPKRLPEPAAWRLRPPPKAVARMRRTPRATLLSSSFWSLLSFQFMHETRAECPAISQSWTSPRLGSHIIDALGWFCVAISWMHRVGRMSRIPKSTFAPRMKENLLQLRILRLRLFQQRQIRIRIFPRAKKILIRRPRFLLVFLQRVSPRQSELRETDEEVLRKCAFQRKHTLKYLRRFCAMSSHQKRARPCVHKFRISVLKSLARLHYLHGLVGFVMIHRDHRSNHRPSHHLDDLIIGSF